MNLPPQVTEDAFKRINEIKGENKALRVAVDGGGCSGFQYRIELTDEVAEDDLLIKSQDAAVAIDPVSLPFLQGAKIDFVRELIGSRFHIDNPNVASSCGCGTSFSI